MLTFAANDAVPVTMLVTRTVRLGSVEAFERWLHEIAAIAVTFEGHLGVSVLRPPSGSRQYTIIFRFRTPGQLRAWIDSDVRARQLEAAEPLCEGPAYVDRLDGIEAWFALPETPRLAAPPRHKMALLTYVAVFALFQIVPRLAAPVLAPLPEVLRVGVVIAMMVALLTYAVMPLATRVFGGWLYRRS
jgi:uncharacterized protein